MTTTMTHEQLQLELKELATRCADDHPHVAVILFATAGANAAGGVWLNTLTALAGDHAQRFVSFVTSADRDVPS